MARLGRLMRLADLRFQAFFHFPINALTLWDFHVLAGLEAWQRRNGPRLGTWFAVLGEVDALAAFGWLAHDNPGWVFPEIDETTDRLAAEGLGHPLLPDDRRVANDVAVGPPGTFVLVTGSNMSGKSTLLRAIGANVVLALAGGPVCARQLSLPRLVVFTSMRVQDSLEAGVSYFMAALQRLKLVVSAADRSPGEGGMLLYLLDEVLQGTNTAERQVAVRHILSHLLELRVVGVVTTHDLELAASPELAVACRAVHFSEGVEREGEGARLSFDYRLRPGVATSRNALKLLELVGLGSRRRRTGSGL
jgi:DNA mismatch repair ATPase MutS